MRRSMVALIVVLLSVVSSVLYFLTTTGQGFMAGNDDVSQRQTTTVLPENGTKNLVVLRQGDMAGYTGWARPSTSLATTFFVVNEDEFTASLSAFETGENFTFRVATEHRMGQKGGALFYVRAYGPGIVTGSVSDLGDGSYRISLPMMDEGLYTLELVLTFSQSTPWDRLPVNNTLGYEGFLISSFPRKVIVRNPASATHDRQPLQLCTASQLYEKDFYSGLYFGRWVTETKTSSNMYTYQMIEETSLDSYASGLTSVGYQMVYQPRECQLFPAERLHDFGLLTKLVPLISIPHKPLHIIFIGDSNMMRQRNLFAGLFNSTKLWTTTMIGIRRGILPRIEEVRGKLADLAALDHHFFVVFNSGLHDIHELCGMKTRDLRSDYIDAPDEQFSCTTAYRNALERFVDLVLQFPALQHVWQTTTAAWPKWGNFGITWPVDSFQPLSKSTHLVEYFNRVAWDVLRARNVSSLDNYWLTLARPDHREIVEEPEGAIANKLAHAGREIYGVMARQILMILFESIAPDYRSLFSTQ